MKSVKLILVILVGMNSLIISQQYGKYFQKKKYIPEGLPVWSETKDLLPIPVLEGNSDWIEMYWKCWEIAFRGFKQPSAGSPLVSNWLDEAFSENIFQWDTIFMIMFARYGHDIFPAIQSLDNFYCLQYESGFIGREFRESDGKLIHFDFDGGLFSDKGWKNMINPPLFSWAEVESFKLTGDKSRFAIILAVLEKYAEWLNRNGDPDAINWEENGRISKTAVHKLYWNTPLGSGMDNTPRPAEKGAGWVEMSSQMVIMYNNLSFICEQLDEFEKSNFYKSEADNISLRINQWCWNENDGFYYDVLADGTQFRKKTIGGFWPLLAGVANREQSERLVNHIKKKNEFWRKIVLPTLSADEEEYNEYGGYWLGSVWAPTNVMVVKGLEKYGYEDLARQITEKYLEGMYEVFKNTGTLYENYAPDHYLPGDPSKDDCVGWTGCGPIQLLFENVIGLRADGTNNTLVWRLNRNDRHGIKNYKLGDNKVSVICEARTTSDDQIMLNIHCNESFLLKIISNEKTEMIEVPGGSHLIKLNM